MNAIEAIFCTDDFRVEEFYVADAGDGEVDQKVYSSSGKFVDEKLHELLFLGYLEERGIGINVFWVTRFFPKCRLLEGGTATTSVCSLFYYSLKCLEIS